MRTKNNWTGERKTILTKDDEETLSSKRMHVALKSQDKQARPFLPLSVNFSDFNGNFNGKMAKNRFLAIKSGRSSLQPSS